MGFDLVVAPYSDSGHRRSFLQKKVNTGAGRANQVPYAWLSHVKALVGMRNIFTHYKPLNVVINSKANLLSLLNIISSSASSGHQSEK